MSKSAQKQSTVMLDFEFNGTTEELVNLVSCVTYDYHSKKTIRWWLHKCPQTQAKLFKHLKQYQRVIGYQCVAEARSFLSLNLDPLAFEWIDMFLEYRMLTNHNDKLQWGNQLVDGKVKPTKKPSPKWERDEEESKEGFKATHSLAEATYKLTGEIRDTEDKKKIRDLIISAPRSFTPRERQLILEYNAADVLFLPTIWEKIKEEYVDFVGGSEYANMQDYFKEAMLRGRYSAHTAIMESTGYPINVTATRNFSRQITSIMSECQRDINSQFKNSGGELPFKWKRGSSQFSWDQKYARKWIQENSEVKKWLKTKPSAKFPDGQLSLALEAWERFFPFKHSYPENNFGAQMVRYLKLKQSLYGFSDSGGKRKNFWDFVGKDGRVRPYMNIYGAQSSRSQPAASGFMFLKPAWMRSLVEPPEGNFIASVDYGQQEFFLSALESGDKNMIAAYLSGDPYLYGAKLAGVIPENGKREDYIIERDLFKNAYLGILYGMTKFGLSVKLTNDTGRKWTEDEAQKQIDIFEATYPEYMEWRKELLSNYESGEGIKLPCGWMVGPDNDNPRSVLNVPIQGFGASIMRKAVDLAAERGLKVIFTLHDAIYIESKFGREKDIGTLMDCMREAFQYYYKGTRNFETAAAIKLDPFAWGKGFERDSEIIVGGRKIPVSDLYRDDRAMDDYNRFSRYFEQPDTDLL